MQISALLSRVDVIITATNLFSKNALQVKICVGFFNFIHCNSHGRLSTFGTWNFCRLRIMIGCSETDAPLDISGWLEAGRWGECSGTIHWVMLEVCAYARAPHVFLPQTQTHSATNCDDDFWHTFRQPSSTPFSEKSQAWLSAQQPHVFPEILSRIGHRRQQDPLQPFLAVLCKSL